MAAARGGAKKARDPHPEQALAELGRRLTEPLTSVLLRGEERFFRDEAVRAVLAPAKARGDEICRHDGDDPEFSLPAILDDLTSGALFAEARTVVLINAGSWLKKGARKFSPGLVDALQARLKALAEGQVQGCLVVAADSLRADHAVAKAVKAAGGVLVGCRRLYDSPPPWDPDPRKAELVSWILDRARRLGVSLDIDDAVYMSNAVGNDPASLVDRLQQLRGRGDEAIQELVTWKAGGSPWKLADQLVDGDAKGATGGIEALFSGGFQGKDGRRVLDRAALVNMLAGAVTTNLMTVTRLAELVASGVSADEAARVCGVRGGPREVKKVGSRLSMRSLASWRSMLEEATDLERRARSGALVDVNDFALLALRWRRAAR